MTGFLSPRCSAIIHAIAATAALALLSGYLRWQVTPTVNSFTIETPPNSVLFGWR